MALYDPTMDHDGILTHMVEPSQYGRIQGPWQIGGG